MKFWLMIRHSLLDKCPKCGHLQMYHVLTGCKMPFCGCKKVY